VAFTFLNEVCVLDLLAFIAIAKALSSFKFIGSGFTPGVTAVDGSILATIERDEDEVRCDDVIATGEKAKVVDVK